MVGGPGESNPGVSRVWIVSWSAVVEIIPRKVKTAPSSLDAQKVALDHPFETQQPTTTGVKLREKELKGLAS